MSGLASATFPKREHIVSEKLIEVLFAKGSSRSVSVFPVKAIFTLVDRQEADTPVQVLISVSKKRFKHAVDRNRVKRQLREAYRHHKQTLTEVVPPDKLLLVAFIWLTDKHSSSLTVEGCLTSLLQKMAQKL